MINPIDWIKEYAMAAVMAVLGVAVLWLASELWLEKGAHEQTTAQLSSLRVQWLQHLNDDITAAAKKDREYRDRERVIADANETQNGVLHAQIASTSARLATALDSLSKRASRPALVARVAQADAAAPAGSATAEQGCGRELLYREDAEVVVQLSGAAAQLRVELLDVRARYDAARTALSERIDEAQQ